MSHTRQALNLIGASLCQAANDGLATRSLAGLLQATRILRAHESHEPMQYRLADLRLTEHVQGPAGSAYSKLRESERG